MHFSSSFESESLWFLPRVISRSTLRFWTSPFRRLLDASSASWASSLLSSRCLSSSSLSSFSRMALVSALFLALLFGHFGLQNMDGTQLLLELQLEELEAFLELLQLVLLGGQLASQLLEKGAQLGFPGGLASGVKSGRTRHLFSSTSSASRSVASTLSRRNAWKSSIISSSWSRVPPKPLSRSPFGSSRCAPVGVCRPPPKTSWASIRFRS